MVTPVRKRSVWAAIAVGVSVLILLFTFFAYPTMVTTRFGLGDASKTPATATAGAEDLVAGKSSEASVTFTVTETIASVTEKVTMKETETVFVTVTEAAIVEDIAETTSSPASPSSVENYDLTEAPDMKFKPGPVDESLLKQAPTDWVGHIRDYLTLLKHPDQHTHTEIQVAERKVRWLQNKRVLMLADSVDRYMAVYMCRELNLAANVSMLGLHSTAQCRIPQLNFTILHWHIASMYTARPDWWWMSHMGNISFEARNEELFMANISAERATDVFGMNGRGPDLIVYQSMLWDWTSMTTSYNMEMGGGKSSGESGDHSGHMEHSGHGESSAPQPKAPKAPAKASSGRRRLSERDSERGIQARGTGEAFAAQRPFHWSELDFYRARQKRFIEYYREIFGADTPFMFRAVLQTRNAASTTVPLVQLDKMARFVAHAMDVEVFDWGHTISGYTQPFYDAFRDEIHPKRGAHTYIYGNMLLYYLFRASGGAEFRGKVTRWPATAGMSQAEAWNECHRYNMKLHSH
ncbi:hypothetical protein BZA70DRAFT_265130 [Myxozyma melibiosi]|uniref:Uncharacterized protein n=1 Tax=Myxozyma melibiosi TaxID=54550 RepID=A0ABR1FD58_9ASCO